MKCIFMNRLRHQSNRVMYIRTHEIIQYLESNMKSQAHEREHTVVDYTQNATHTQTLNLTRHRVNKLDRAPLKMHFSFLISVSISLARARSRCFAVYNGCRRALLLNARRQFDAHAVTAAAAAAIGALSPNNNNNKKQLNTLLLFVFIRITLTVCVVVQFLLSFVL